MERPSVSLRQQFCKYVIQNIFGMIGVSIYIIADTFFISVTAGADGITVLNLSLPIYGVIFAIGALVGIGTATRFAILRAQGQKDADAYFWNAILWLILFSIPFVLIGIFAPQWLLRLMGADTGIAALGENYARYYLIFTPFFMCNYVCTAYVRNDGQPGRAMLATICSSLFNIVFDYLLIFPCGLGLKGAALATGISPILSIFICSTHFFGKKNTIPFAFRGLSVRRLRASVPLGISAFVGEMSSAVTTTVFNFLLLGLAGNIGVAAYGVVANFALVAVAIFNGISQGVQPLISRFCGENRRTEIRQLLRMGWILALCVAVGLIAVVFAFPDPLVRLFNSEGLRELADYARDALRFYFVGYLFAGVNIVMTGYFAAVDQPKAAFLSSVLRGFLAVSICACVMAQIFGINGVWFSFAVGEAITTLLCLVLLKRSFRKATRI